MNKYLVVIAGPTASGKTNLAIRLTGIFSAEIISADSRQFYKGLSIGTAAPGIEQLAQAKHHFIGHIPVTENYNVSRFEQDVISFLELYFSTANLAIMAGGSGLYIDAVCNGIDELPDPDPDLRNSLKNELQKFGIGFLRNKLKTLDPEFYARVDLDNPNRLMRAIEVSVMTGRPYSELRTKIRKSRDFNIIKIALNIPRPLLIERINMRVDEMIEKGLVDEVKAFYEYKDCNALNTVGYKEIIAYLDKKISLDQAIEKIKTNTRRYAKRQLTWFRKDKDYTWFEPTDENGIIRFILERTGN